MKYFASLLSVSALAGIPLVLAGLSGLTLHRHSRTPTPRKSAHSVAAKQPAPPRQVKIDLDKSVALTLPEMKTDLQPAEFRTPDGRTGWCLRIPGNRPIATPAYDKGVVFLGGGYGSHEFYAFDAATGRKIWAIHTSDDGPTAAVVEQDLVAFNTESCTVCVVKARTGELVWQEWLGDPLMSQPAIYKGKLYIAYPAGGRAQSPNGFGQQAPNATINAAPNASNAASAAPNTATGNPQKRADIAPHPKHTLPNPPLDAQNSHILLCADLRTGDHLWKQGITADVITAPVVEDGRLFFTCMDGTGFCLNADTGKIIWKRAHAGTSAPVIANGQVVTTVKANRNGAAYEGITRMDAKTAKVRDSAPLAESKAGYLTREKGGGVALSAPMQQSLDSSVGFGNGAPAAAQMNKATNHLGVNSVAGGWAYQGSRAAFSRGQMLNAQGRYLNALSASGGKLNWRAEVQGKSVTQDAQVFSPPALGRENLYLCSALGHLASVSQADGKVNFLYATQQTMPFQPALAEGNLYAGTGSGLLICLKTGSKDASGWTAWGGNAQHNKKQ